MLVLLLFAATIFHIASTYRDKSLKVIFLDVGQGDSILISQGSQQILIDGGSDGKVLLEKLGRYIPFWDRKIEAVIATHPDQDHIGGLVDALRTYKVENIIESRQKSSSQIYKLLEETEDKKHVERIIAQKGEKLIFPYGAQMEILFPFSSDVDEQEQNNNAASIVSKLSFGRNSFLLTGDLPLEKEKVLMESGEDVESNVLKVAHHGSKYSTSNEFLDAVKPKEAIISVGANNKYGHPNAETLERLKNHGADILRTDEKGDVIFECPDLDANCLMASQ